MEKDPRGLKLLLSIAACLVVGWIGGLFTQKGLLCWYPTLNKPSWTPPDEVFPWVWTALYLMMGFSLWLIWISRSKISKKTAFTAFGFQLFFNFIWPFLFFYLENPLLGLIDIYLLELGIILTMITFWKFSQCAVYLLIPYLLWVTYALTLNYSIWINN